MPETLDANKVNTMAQGIDVLEDYLLTLDRELLTGRRAAIFSGQPRTMRNMEPTTPSLRK